MAPPRKRDSKNRALPENLYANGKYWQYRMAKNTIRISTGKTENYAVPIHLEIEMGTDLRQVVTECLSTPIASPYLLCYMPKRRRRDQMEAKLHWSAVTDDYLSKQFTKARDDCGRTTTSRTSSRGRLCTSCVRWVRGYMKSRDSPPSTCRPYWVMPMAR